MTASRSVTSETNGERSSAGGGRAFALDTELVSGTWFPVVRRPVERALTGRGGLSFALIGFSPVAVTCRRLPSWADKFRPDGPVVLSLGDGTGRDSIPLNRVTFCNALLLDLLLSNSEAR
jgi:hypothetical protein